MEPLDDAIANYVQRHVSPDGRTVLDLIWVFEPDDFRELGGQRRPRIYEADSGETVLDLIRCECGVLSHSWEEDGALALAMAGGAGLRVALARGEYAMSVDGWAAHPIGEIQRHACSALGESR